jgi:hypothetical protein
MPHLPKPPPAPHQQAGDTAHSPPRRRPTASAACPCSRGSTRPLETPPYPRCVKTMGATRRAALVGEASAKRLSYAGVIWDSKVRNLAL